jgi:glutamine amidotransferase-like uncharacterized protein
VAQGIGPEFNPQYCKKRKQKAEKVRNLTEDLVSLVR